VTESLTVTATVMPGWPVPGQVPAVETPMMARGTQAGAVSRSAA
jgi:hypothetical protein